MVRGRGEKEVQDEEIYELESQKIVEKELIIAQNAIQLQNYV